MKFCTLTLNECDGSHHHSDSKSEMQGFMRVNPNLQYSINFHIHHNAAQLWSIPNPKYQMVNHCCDIS